MNSFLKSLCLVPVAALAAASSAWAGSSSTLLEISASGDSGYIRGYGAYIQVNYDSAHRASDVQYCDNIPYGGDSPSSRMVRHGEPDFACMRFTLDELRRGKGLISFRSTDFLTLSAPGFDAANGGTVKVAFVKSVGITGIKRRTLKIRVDRPSAGSDFQAALDTKRGIEPMDWLHINVDTTLSIPDGVSSVRVYNDGRELPRLNLDRDL